MSQACVRVVDVYPYRRTATGIQFLVLRRAAGRPYAGQWRMVGGKIEEGEAAWQAALRELKEETGYQPQQLWAIPSVNQYYEWQHDRVNIIPAFAAEVGGEPALDAEHEAWLWLPAVAAADKLQWPEQKRLLRLADELLQHPLVPEWCIPHSCGVDNGQ